MVPNFVKVRVVTQDNFATIFQFCNQAIPNDTSMDKVNHRCGRKFSKIAKTAIPDINQIIVQKRKCISRKFEKCPALVESWF